jgi:hypothetical protein
LSQEQRYLFWCAYQIPVLQSESKHYAYSLAREAKSLDAAIPAISPRCQLAEKEH